MVQRLMPPHTDRPTRLPASAADLSQLTPCSCCSSSAPAWSRPVALQSAPKQPPSWASVAAAVGHLLLHLTQCVLGLWDGVECLNSVHASGAAGKVPGATSGLISIGPQLARLRLQLARQLLYPLPQAGSRTGQGSGQCVVMMLVMTLVLAVVGSTWTAPDLRVSMGMLMLPPLSAARVLLDVPRLLVRVSTLKI